MNSNITKLNTYQTIPPKGVHVGDIDMACTDQRRWPCSDVAVSKTIYSVDFS